MTCLSDPAVMVVAAVIYLGSMLVVWFVAHSFGVIDGIIEARERYGRRP